MMPLQRVRVAESRMRNKLANGPLRVQSNVKLLFHKVFCNVRAYVSCRGYEGIPLSAQGHSCEFKVAPRILYFCMIRP